MKALTIFCMVLTILTVISQNEASSDFDKRPIYEVKDPRKSLNSKIEILNSRKQNFLKKQQLKQLRAKRRNGADALIYTTFEAPVTRGVPKYPVVLNKVSGVRPRNKAEDWQRFADPLGLIRKKRAAPQYSQKSAKPAQKTPKPKPKYVSKVRRQLNAKGKGKTNVLSTRPRQALKSGLTKKPPKARRGGHRKTSRHSKSKKNSQKQRQNRHKSGHKALRQKTAPKTVKTDQESRRLIAATDCQIEDYPYVVSIQKGGEHWCGGALLNPRIVITTANCVWKSKQLSRMKIRAGSRMASSGGQTARIQEVMKHPDWNIRSTPNADVAMILLDRSIKFSDSVHGADLPNRALMPPFEDAWITSWGSERRDGLYNADDLMTLQVVHTYLMSREQCNNITMRFGVAVNENFICFQQTGRRAPCTRDTGAPAVSDGVVWGLASWGIRKLCGTERFPAIFTYLGSESNQNFIINATKVLMSELRESPFLDRFPYREPATVARKQAQNSDARKINV